MSSMAYQEVSICVPVEGSEDQVVEIPFTELPAEVEDTLELLRSVLAPLHVWLDFAKAYLANGQVDAFLHILREGTGPEVEEHFVEAKFERLQMHCALASFYLNKAVTMKDRTARNNALTRATSHLNKGLGIDVNEQLPVLGLGQVALAKGDLQQARLHFEKAANMTSNGKKNISGLAALANLNFQQDHFREALSLYCRALREHPGCPPEIRLGIAACNFRLGAFQSARAAYERTLQLSPDCCEALLGLAVLSFNAPDADSGLRDGMQLLCKAYNSNPLHPGVLNMLAHFSLLRGDLAKAKSLASTALETAQTDQSRAQSLTILARASHSAGAVQDAFRFYQQAYKLTPNAALPLLGLAQMNLLQKENTNAISLLEQALQYVPGWNDALVVLGNLYPQMEARRGQAAVEHFKSAAEKNTSSGQVLEMLGELLATSNPAGSLAAYKRSLELYSKEKAALKMAKAKAQKRGTTGSTLPNGTAKEGNASASAVAMDRVGDEAQPSQQQAANELTVAAVMETVEGREDAAEDAEDDGLPAKLLNNAAALHLRGGEKQAALRLMYEAVEAARRPGASGLAASNQITLGYNLARAKEATGDLGSAGKEYKEILKEFPEYLDCYFRLAWIARCRGHYAEALQWAEKALDVKPKDANALALIGFLHMEKREWKEAEDTFTELRKEPSAKADLYAVLALGAIPLNSLSSSRRKSRFMQEDPAKVERLLTIACNNFRTVLERDEHNVFAAHGLAAVLAEEATRAEPPRLEYLQPAKKVFDKVKEAAASAEPWLQLPDLAENLGHMALAEGRVKDALQIYGSVQRRHHRGTSAQMLLLCSRALYDEDGRRSAAESRKPSLLPEARTCLYKAIHLDPANMTLRFNAAFVMQEWAVRMLKKDRPENDPTKALEFAGAMTDLAQAFKVFRHLRKLGPKLSGIEEEKAEKHLIFCQQTHEKGTLLLQQAVKEEEALEAKRQQSRIELEAATRERKAREQAAKRREARRVAERDERAKQVQQRMQELQATWAENKAHSEAVSEGDALKVDKRRKKKKREEEVDALFGDSDEDDGGDYDPNAPEEAYVEYLDGERQPQANGGGDAGRNALAGTGLESDDEEMAEAEASPGDRPPGGSSNAGATAEPTAPPSHGRLKRRRPEAEEAQAGPHLASDFDDLFGGSDEEGRPPQQPQQSGDVGMEEAGGGGDAPAAKRRDIDLFGDSEEEE